MKAASAHITALIKTKAQQKKVKSDLLLWISDFMDKHSSEFLSYSARLQQDEH